MDPFDPSYDLADEGFEPLPINEPDHIDVGHIVFKGAHIVLPDGLTLMLLLAWAACRACGKGSLPVFAHGAHLLLFALRKLTTPSSLALGCQLGKRVSKCQRLNQSMSCTVLG